MIVANPHIRTLATYTPGASPEQIKAQFGLESVEKLASNENPRGASPLAMAAAQDALTHAHIYGDGGALLQSVIANHHGVEPTCVSVHNGSDAIIHQIMRTFLLPGETALSSEGTFVSFGLAVAAADRASKRVPMAPRYRYDVQALVDAVDSSTKIIYIANPNNPTGTYVNADELSWLVEEVPSSVLVVVDEAYCEYAHHLVGADYPNVQAMERENVVQLRTFSKAYGLAALRIGYALGHPNTISWLQRTKLPFDPNAIGCAAAIAALADSEFVRQTVLLNESGLSALHAALDTQGLLRSESVANFVMADLGTAERASAMHRALLFDGFITRPLTGFGLPTCLRITTGLPEQNVRVATALATHAKVILDSEATALPSLIGVQ